MMKFFLYPILATLFALALSIKTFAVSDVDWIDLVQQKLTLEKDVNTPDGFLAKYPSEQKKSALEKALNFYYDSFETFYNDIMSVIDPCGEWCDLKDYLLVSKQEIDKEYEKIKRKNSRSSFRFGFDEESKFKPFQAEVSNFYEHILDVIKYITIEGQNKQVQLFKKALAEKRQEKIQERRIEQGDILKDENGE